MKTLKISLVLFAMLTVIASCKKGDKGDSGPAGTSGPPGPTGSSTVDPRLYNKWQVISGGTYLYDNSGYPPLYLIINSDNICTYLMQDSVYGFKDYYSSFALVTATQICIYNCHNYSISGDTLRLTNPMTGTAVCVKNVNAPDLNQWFGQITSAIDSFAAPPYYNGGDFGFDGQYLWVADGSTLFKIDPVTHYVMNSIPLSFSASYMSVEYAAGFLWVSDNYPRVHKINPVNGSDVLQSPYLGSNYIFGLAWDNQYMWCDDGNYLYQYNIGFNSIGSQSYLPNGYSFRGAAYTGGYYYLCAGSTIYKCTINPFKVVKSYITTFNTHYIYGIAFDGANFWVSTQGFSSYMLYKISLN